MKKKTVIIQRLEIKFDSARVASGRRSVRKIFKKTLRLEQSAQTCPLIARSSKVQSKSHEAVESARRTLKHMDMNEFWRRVLCRVAPLLEANERVRMRSLFNAHRHFVD